MDHQIDHVIRLTRDSPSSGASDVKALPVLDSAFKQSLWRSFNRWHQTSLNLDSKDSLWQGVNLLDFDFEPDFPAWARRLCVFDLETTGLNLSTSRIVTACVAVIDASGELEEAALEVLINPGIEIPAEAAAVHGVTTEKARAEGIDPEVGVTQIISALTKALDSGAPLLAFNAPYDFTILMNEANRYGLQAFEPNPVIDPLVLDRKVNKFRKGKRNLTVLCADFGVKLLDAHNSTADAIAAGRLGQALARKYPELNMPADELHSLQKKWSDEQSLDFAKFMKTQRPDFEPELGWPLKVT